MVIKMSARLANFDPKFWNIQDPVEFYNAINKGNLDPTDSTTRWDEWSDEEKRAVTVRMPEIPVPSCEPRGGPMPFVTFDKEASCGLYCLFNNLSDRV